MTLPAASSTIALAGASGASYPFSLFQWGTTFRPVCAVYAVFTRGFNGRYTVLYVGQTGDCSVRFDDHHKVWCFRASGATHIGLMVENSERSRLLIESDLIAGYRPPCNG